MRQLIISTILLAFTLANLFPTSLAAKSTGIPRFDRAVSAGVAYLKKSSEEIEERETSLIAYALLKAGESPESELVVRGIEDAKERTDAGHAGYERIYLAGVDAMLLAETDSDENVARLAKIADFIMSSQHASGGWSEHSANADTSMAQYGMLALWAAQRVGVEISPQTVENNVRWHLQNGTADGGWAYRPEKGGKTWHNLVAAGAGSLGIGRLLLYGPKNRAPKEKEQKKFDVLTKVKTEAEIQAQKPGFPGYDPRISRQDIDKRIGRAFNWVQVRFPPPGKGASGQPYYFFYALERAAALNDPGNIGGVSWYEAYGDALLRMQANDGAFNQGNNHTTPRIGTAFAILYLMRSTKQILDKQFGTGIMRGGRDLASLYGEKKKEKKDLGPLDALLAEMENADLSSLENLDADDFAEKITVTSREELVGQIDLLKKLVEHKDPSNRQAAYYALGRTGDLSLIPEILKGLRDPNLDVNVEALNALRYISRKPNGFGIPLTPLAGAETADAERKVVVANVWRNKAWNAWAGWYRQVRPYNEGGGIDEVELLGRP